MVPVIAKLPRNHRGQLAKLHPASGLCGWNAASSRKNDVIGLIRARSGQAEAAHGTPALGEPYGQKMH
jgi:hypothetical protein